jgi:hypothetical protein
MYLPDPASRQKIRQPLTIPKTTHSFLLPPDKTAIIVFAGARKVVDKFTYYINYKPVYSQKLPLPKPVQPFAKHFV